MLPALIWISLLFSMPTKAQLYHEEALQLLRDAEQKKLDYLKEAEQLKTDSTQFIQKTLTPKKAEQETSSCSPHLSQRQQNDNQEYLIFVSFSLPKETLQSLYHEAQIQGIPLVLRGLKENSFQKTATYLKDLDIGLQIDPELFKKYHIDKVPTFVRIDKDHYHTISGNISFQYAKQKFSEITK